MSWWVDEESFDNTNAPDEVYLCEGEEGDMIRFTCHDVKLARDMCDYFNNRCLTRAEGDALIEKWGLDS